MSTGSAPISTTRASPIGCTGAGAVTAQYDSRSRPRSMLVPVKAMAGWMASGIAPARVAGASTAIPTPATVCTTSCPACHTPAAASPLTNGGQLLLGDGEQHEFAALDDVRHGEDRHAGQHGLCPIPARVGDGGDSDDGVPGTREGCAEHRSDVTGTDDPDTEPSRWPAG